MNTGKLYCGSINQLQIHQSRWYIAMEKIHWHCLGSLEFFFKSTVLFSVVDYHRETGSPTDVERHRRSALRHHKTGEQSQGASQHVPRPCSSCWEPGLHLTFFCSAPYHVVIYILNVFTDIQYSTASWKRTCCADLFLPWTLVLMDSHFLNCILHRFSFFCCPTPVSVCLSRCNVPEKLSRSSCDLHQIVTQPFWFPRTKYEPSSSRGSPSLRASNGRGVS